MSKAKTVGLWVLTVLTAVAFLGAGSPKLTGDAKFVENFARYGYPVWFLYVTGAIEVGSALLLLVPRTATLGAFLLVCTMLGASLTHLRAAEYSHLVAPLVLLVFAVIIGLARRDRVVPPFHRIFARRAAHG